MKTNPVADKIAALLAKTVENGASESEAMAALETANKLMSKHGITLDEIKADRVDYDFTAKPASDRKKAHPVDFYLAGEIAQFTDTQSLIIQMGLHDNRYTFIGYSIDVDYAVFVRTMIFEAMESGWAAFKTTLKKGDHASKYRSSYMLGMATRVRAKMRELKQAAAVETGTELVVCKQQLVRSKMEKMFPGTKTMEVSTAAKVNNGAYATGYKDGDKVGLRRQFDTDDDGPLMIASA